jgi:quinol-cytochrome oxidoreductase complex cytochrome b subunit
VVVGFIKDLVFFLPSRKRLTYSWNFGIMLGLLLVFQIITGTVLVFFYTPDRALAFNSVQYIMFEVNFGWVFRVFHFNGASVFFFFIYLHFFKALFFGGFRLGFVWLSGLTILLLLMAEAFIGYVLVWAQIRFWASVVITSLLSVFPVFGQVLVN